MHVLLLKKTAVVKDDIYIKMSLADLLDEPEKPNQEFSLFRDITEKQI